MTAAARLPHRLLIAVIRAASTVAPLRAAVIDWIYSAGLTTAGIRFRRFAPTARSLQQQWRIVAMG